MFALLFIKIYIIIVYALLPYRLSSLLFIASTDRNVLVSSSRISFKVLIPDLQNELDHNGEFLKQELVVSVQVLI